MIDIDGLIRDFRSSVPVPEVGAIDVRVDELRRGRPGRRRGVLLGFSAVGAIALTAGLIALFVRSDKTSVTLGAGRVDWGMAAVVTLTPDPWTDPDKAASEATASLRSEAERLGIAGMEIRTTGVNELTLRVPGAEATSQLRFLLMIPRVRILDYETSVIADGERLTDLAAAARRAARPGQRVRFVIASIPGRGGTFGPNRVLPNLAAARAEQAAYGGPTKADILAIPTGLTVVTAYSGPRSRLYLLRERPIARGSEIRTRLALRPSLEVGVTSVVVARARQLTRRSSRRVIAVAVDAGANANPPSFVGVGDLDLASAVVSFDPQTRGGNAFSRGPMAQPNLGSRLGLYTAAPYGPQPLQTYPQTDVRLPWNPGVPAENFVSPISIDVEGRRATVVIQKRNQSAMFTGIRVDGGPNNSGVMGGGCYLGLDTPAVTRCLTAYQGQRIVHAGRARPDVASVDALLPSGAVAHAAVTNGWYMLSWVKERGRLGLRLPTLVALDREGHVLGRETAAGAIVQSP